MNVIVVICVCMSCEVDMSSNSDVRSQADGEWFRDSPDTIDNLRVYLSLHDPNSEDWRVSVTPAELVLEDGYGYYSGYHPYVVDPTGTVAVRELTEWIQDEFPRVKNNKNQAVFVSGVCAYVNRDDRLVRQLLLWAPMKLKAFADFLKVLRTDYHDHVSAGEDDDRAMCARAVR